MRHHVRWLLGMLFLFTVFAMTRTPIHAQGIYDAVSLSDDEGVGDLETDLSGFVGGSECAQVTTLWSDFNGVTAYGGDGFDNIIQTVEANPGVTYIWNWGFTYQYADPYTGLCDDFSESFTVPLSAHITYYNEPHLQGTAPNQTCLWVNVVCNPPLPTATCIGDVVTGPPPPACDYDTSILKTFWLVANGVCSQPVSQTAPDGVGACS